MINIEETAKNRGKHRNKRNPEEKDRKEWLEDLNAIAEEIRREQEHGKD